jgi:hypothetical protein
MSFEIKWFEFKFETTKEKKIILWNVMAHDTEMNGHHDPAFQP